MSENAENAFQAVKTQIGNDAKQGDWFEVDQQRVNDFADATLDHQFIHIDPEKAAQTPFGGPIAHGFLTLSLLVHLVKSVPSDLPPHEGILMGVNYGMNKVRFINPVPVGSNVRASSRVMDATLKGSAVDVINEVTVEIEGQEKPALVAEWITRMVFA